MKVKAGSPGASSVAVGLAEFLIVRNQELYARELFESVARDVKSRTDERRELLGALERHGVTPGHVPPAFREVFAEDSEDRAQILSNKFSVVAFAALSEMAVTHELSRLTDESQRELLHAELSLLELVRIAHTRRLCGTESAEGESILEQLHRVVLKYSEAVQREYSLYDAGETMRRNSNVATLPIIPRVTQAHAVKRLRHFIRLLCAAIQLCAGDKAAVVARIYVAKMADAACQLGFGSGPIAESYSGRLFESAYRRLLAPRGKRTDRVDSLLRYALRLRGLSMNRAGKLSEIGA
jgi:hypothetical protein